MKAEITYVIYNVNEYLPGIAIIGGFYLSIHMICKIYYCNLLYGVLLHLILKAFIWLCSRIASFELAALHP